VFIPGFREKLKVAIEIGKEEEMEKPNVMSIIDIEAMSYFEDSEEVGP